MPNIHLLIKPASSLCNLRCQYCFYADEAENREVASYGIMKESTLEIIIKKALEYTDTACTIAYQGGEPTLAGLDFFKKSIEFQEKYNQKGIHIDNAIQINGVGLSDEFITFFKENNFLVGISLDGTKKTHDVFRKDAYHKDTFKEVFHTIKRLQKKDVPFNVLTVVHTQTARHIQSIYEFYKKEGLTYLQFIPCLNPLDAPLERFPYTLTPKMYGEFLKSLFDMWYKDMIQGTEIHIQQFENYVLMLMGQPPTLCGMSGVCSHQHVIEADGEVYPCDFYVLDDYKLGNLTTCSFADIQEKRAQLHFVEDSKPLHKDCQACRFLPICRGGCRRNRLGSDSDCMKNYFCEAYYEFFSYSISRFEELASYFSRYR